MTEPDRCWTCGRPRGLSQRRGSWQLEMPTPWIPRTGDPSDKPAQSGNDLICHVSVYRNGGTNESTHLCDECLRVGVRAIKVRLDALLEQLDAGDEKEKYLAELTERLAKVQFRYGRLAFDHNRMQDRLRDILPPPKDDEPEPLRMARWEVARGHAKEEA